MPHPIPNSDSGSSFAGRGSQYLTVAADTNTETDCGEALASGHQKQDTLTYRSPCFLALAVLHGREKNTADCWPGVVNEA